MAASPAPLVWDFHRQIGNDEGVLTGGVVHFYDETAQTIFLNGGIKTRLSEPVNGHWDEAELSFPSAFINETDYSRLNLDHPVNGTIYGVTIENSNLEFVRYQYAADLSDLVENISYSQQIDNPITQINATIINAGKDFFLAEGSLFNAGSRMTLKVAFGDSELYPICVAYVDEAPYDELDKSVSITGRNAIGYFLKESIFGSETTFAGTYPETIGWIMTSAGVPKWLSMPGEGSISYDYFKPTDTLLEGLNWINDIMYYSNTDPLQLTEFSDGTVYCGKRSLIAEKMPNGYYTFNAESDVFKRKITKNVDAVYSKLYVTGKTMDNEDLVPVTVPVSNYQLWNVPPKKMLKLAAPEGWVATQHDLQWWAEHEATKKQYSGITEDFDIPFRPQLLAGDVAEILEDGVGVTLGVITSVEHKMGRKGFSTSFSCDSGGQITVTDDGVAAEVSGEYGYNRKQTITDIIRKAVNK